MTAEPIGVVSLDTIKEAFGKMIAQLVVENAYLADQNRQLKAQLAEARLKDAGSIKNGECSSPPAPIEHPILAE